MLYSIFVRDLHFQQVLRSMRRGSGRPFFLAQWLVVAALPAVALAFCPAMPRARASYPWCAPIMRCRTTRRMPRSELRLQEESSDHSNPSLDYEDGEDTFQLQRYRLERAERIKKLIAKFGPKYRSNELVVLEEEAPVHFEKFDDGTKGLRVAKRIETVLSRRTARLILILERLADGHNYSAIFRTCEALGIQQIWIIGPPKERFLSRRTLNRAAALERATAFARSDENRRTTDDQLQPGSRRMRMRERAERVLDWAADAEFAAEHAMHGRGATRFLTIRDFDDVNGVLEALKSVPDCELWASDLGQSACVLEHGAAWIGSQTIPKRVALCLGTESTGVSHQMLASSKRRVYLPMDGFSDSFNVGVAAALAIERLKALLGGGGDYLTDDWVRPPQPFQSFPS